MVFLWVKHLFIRVGGKPMQHNIQTHNTRGARAHHVEEDLRLRNTSMENEEGRTYDGAKNQQFWTLRIVY